jgi:hypothetical protein
MPNTVKYRVDMASMPIMNMSYSLQWLSNMDQSEAGALALCGRYTSFCWHLLILEHALQV